MSALEDLIQKISDEDLRRRIQKEVANLKKTKKFGLVFEPQNPEFTPLYNVPVKKNSLVALKAKKISETYRVISIDGHKIFCVRGDKVFQFDLNEVVSVAQFGDSIYPCLQKIDEVCNAPDSDLWHALIEADNYHALQLLKYLYAGKVDCIYIDPPYNTGARDWKYNNDYVDAADSYRHSKWLSMMQKRLELAKEILSDSGAIFISIDDNEQATLKLLCDEIFGRQNYQAIYRRSKTFAKEVIKMKTYRFKLYKSERNEKLHKQINAAGLIYNHCIALHKRYYKIFGKYLNKNRLQKHLVKLKKIDKFSYIKEIGSQAVQDITDRIDKAFQLFFSNLKRKVRCSPPNFKKVMKYKSFTLKQKAGWKLDENTYTLKVNGQNYRYFRSRRISGKVKTVTIKRDSLGDIYVCIVTDAKDFLVETRTGESVGFDFGLKKFLTASDGKDIISPLFFAQNSTVIKKACKNLFHKKKGSNNRRKAVLNLARLYRKTFNQRHDFHFKLARQLCLKYETICIEDLNVKGMQRLYGKKIGDLAFSEFVNILKYTASKFGVEILEVDRYFASSQICHSCGYKNSAVKDLNVREWICPNCETKHDRDSNAAINILRYGLGHRPLQETL